MYSDVLDRLAKSLSESELFESAEFAEAVRISAQARVNAFCHRVPQARGVSEMLEGHLITRTYQLVEQLVKTSSPAAWLRTCLDREVAEAYDTDKYASVGLSYKTGRRAAKRDEPITVEHLPDDLPERPEVNDDDDDDRRTSELMQTLLLWACEDSTDQQIIKLLAAGTTQTEAATRLRIDQGTLSRRVKAIQKSYWQWAARSGFHIPGSASRKPSLIRPRRRGVA